MKKIFIYLLLISAGICSVVIPVSAKAYSNNNLIDDVVFDNYGSMDSNSIQNFLNQFPSSCIKDYSSPLPDADPYKAYSTYGANATAAQVIKRTSDVWGVNPMVILTKLQQEESLVKGDAGCDGWRYNSAMGYKCPDSGGCDPAYAGFTQQVVKGVWQLKFNKEVSTGNNSWQGNGDIVYGGYMTTGNFRRCSSCQITYYDGYATIDGNLIHMDTGSTASLYSYTPHVPSSFPSIFENLFGKDSTKSSSLSDLKNYNMGTELVSGAKLLPRQYLLSADKHIVLVLQDDGNLVLYRNGIATWSSLTWGKTPSQLEMQTDGSLVITFTDNTRWSSNTLGNAGSRLALQNDGNLVIYNTQNKPTWNTNTWLSSSQLSIPNNILKSGLLYKGQQLESPNGRYKLIFQDDGNLVLYSPFRAVWNSNSWNMPTRYTVMQGDGNLVIYDFNKKSYWNSSTWGRGESRLTVQDDGNLVIYSSKGSPTWWSNTIGRM